MGEVGERERGSREIVRPKQKLGRSEDNSDRARPAAISHLASGWAVPLPCLYFELWDFIELLNCCVCDLLLRLLDYERAMSGRR